MGSVKLNFGRVFLVSAEHNSDIVKFVTDFAKKQEIKTATFTAIGALKSAKLGSTISTNTNIRSICFLPLKKLPAA